MDHHGDNFGGRGAEGGELTSPRSEGTRIPLGRPRVFPASSPIACPGGGSPLRSDISSTGRHRQPGVGQGQQPVDSGINPDRRRRGWGSGGGDLDTQRHEPATGPILADRNRRRHGTIRDLPRPHHLQRCVRQLRQPQLTIPERESTRGEFRRPPRPLPGFEPREPALAFEEFRVGGIQVSQRLLQRHTRHLVQKRVLGRFLPGGQHGRSRTVADFVLPLLPGIAAGLQPQVVHQPHTAKRPCQQLGLGWSRVEAEPEPPLHDRPHPHRIEHPYDRRPGGTSPPTSLRFGGESATSILLRRAFRFLSGRQAGGCTEGFR
ncbi:hypothetical protein CLV67_103315 [Actinoplanes italicus]|uniref:Uncharacterized protein n=1 Tax=Actinoplanes italicus TaxID=113567 RepID=A0A2T0KJS0_9ACTN|nr:hypothetical protein CLV67_103315 [Actinoplanes italicus]